MQHDVLEGRLSASDALRSRQNICQVANDKDKEKYMGRKTQGQEREEIG